MTATTYQAADTSNWILGLATHVAVTSSVPANAYAPQTRFSDFTYNPAELPNSGLLASSTAETGQSSSNAAGQVSQLAVPTTYHYDSFGNQTSVTLAPSDEAARTTTTSWATPATNLNTGPQYDQFPQSVTDAMGYTAHYGYNISFGSVAVASDLNGRVTTTSYDTFGRPLLTLGPDGTGTRMVYTYCAPIATGCGYNRDGDAGRQQRGGNRRGRDRDL
ncbi:MAG: hypothetical protein WDN69_15490 [Aliidongia sp.]